MKSETRFINQNDQRMALAAVVTEATMAWDPDLHKKHLSFHRHVFKIPFFECNEMSQRQTAERQRGRKVNPKQSRGCIDIDQLQRCSHRE